MISNDECVFQKCAFFSEEAHASGRILKVMGGNNTSFYKILFVVLEFNDFKH